MENILQLLTGLQFDICYAIIPIQDGGLLPVFPL